VEFWEDLWLAESITTFLSAPRPIVHDSAFDLKTEAIINASWINTGRIPSHVYSKGSAILEMLESIVGSGRMRRLLREYVRAFEFKAANTTAFLQLMERCLGDEHGNISEFLDSWLRQGSHPLVFIEYNQTSTQFTLTQTPKMGDPAVRWPIPIWIECTEGTVPETLYWLHKDRPLTVNLSVATHTNSSSAVAFNRNRSVYYELSIRP